LGDQFSQAHYYSPQWSSLPNVIDIGQAISVPGRVEDLFDKHTDRIAENKAAS